MSGTLGHYSIEEENSTIQPLQKAHDEVLRFFDSIYPTSIPLQNTIRELSTIIHMPRRSRLGDIGEVHKDIYFVLQGSIRTYYLDKEGKDVTSWLLFEGDLGISVYSFYKQQPSFEAMETLEDSVLLHLSHSNLIRLYSEHLEFNFIGRTLTEQYYIRSEAKANNLRMLTATERYRKLMAEYPFVFQRVALRYIASYLGITQSTLSRIRGRNN